jgi:hypothetical protein
MLFTLGLMLAFVVPIGIIWSMTLENIFDGQ